MLVSKVLAIEGVIHELRDVREQMASMPLAADPQPPDKSKGKKKGKPLGDVLDTEEAPQGTLFQG
jgi:hypothetical protein